MSKQRRASLMALAALVLIGIWVDMTGYLDVFSNPLSTDSTEELPHYSCYVGRAMTALAFLLMPRWFDAPLERSLPPAFGCVIGGTLLYSFGFNQFLLDPLLVSIFGAALVGAGHVWSVSLAYAYVRGVGSDRDALLVIVAAQIVERLLVEVLGFFPAGPGFVVVSYLLPCAAMCVLVVANRTCVRYRPEHPAGRDGIAVGAQRRYYIVLCVMAGVGLVACGAMSTVGIWGNAGAGQYAGGGSSLVLASVECLLVIALCRATFSMRQKKPLALRYQSSLLVLITGFALTSSHGMLALPGGLVGALLVVVENYAHILFWIVAFDAASSLGWPVYRAFGVSNLACGIAGLMWSVFLERQMIVAESAVFVVFYLIIIVCVVYPQVFNRASMRSSNDERDINAFTFEGERRLTPGVNGAALQLALEQRCACIARDYALSTREGEVLVLLVKGTTRQNMCRHLHLSEGTVKTHLTHIYEKLGIHSQAELLDIAYDVGNSSRGGGGR